MQRDNSWFCIAKMCCVVSSHRLFSSPQSSVASLSSLAIWFFPLSAGELGRSRLQLFRFGFEVRHRDTKDFAAVFGFHQPWTAFYNVCSLSAHPDGRDCADANDNAAFEDLVFPVPT